MYSHFLFNFVWGQFQALPQCTTDFAGQTVIVTGANSGLGKEAARHFTRLGASKVVLGCRSAEKGEAAKKDIESTTGITGVVEVWTVDLCSFESVKDFCRQASKLTRLDVVIANAGLAIGSFESQEGYESTITVNVISTFLMALMLLPKLRQTAAQFNVAPHLSIITSVAHRWVSLTDSGAAPVSDMLTLVPRPPSWSVMKKTSSTPVSYPRRCHTTDITCLSFWMFSWRASWLRE
jgi:short-subunit dehydrogenase involved in D-alanine esterification of teichoic acids